MEAYRCRIDVSSELGVGTRFDLYIPFAMEKRRHLNLSFKSIYKSLRVILGHEHASFRACFLCVFMVK
ncbi:MAG: hypothetical protein ACLTZB_01920 [Streptococcus salivarius]